MDEVKINTSKTLTLTLPSDPDNNFVSVSVYHEFGGLVYGPTTATRTAPGVYSITLGQQVSGIYILNSAGKHRVQFSYAVSNSNYSQSQYINVYTPYITSSEFFTLYPELQQEFGALFDRFERRARNVINTYCGQSFDYYPNKYLIIDGNNHVNLHMPIPVVSISKVTMNPGDETEEVIHDITSSGLNNVEKVRQPFNFDSSYYIRYRNKGGIGDDDRSSRSYDFDPVSRFGSKSDYKIEGDFGWQYVPENVMQASALLVADYMNNDNEYRAHGIFNVDMDAVTFQMKSSFYESTGNIEADVLLMDYTLFVMDYIV
jgi:hypothetical protein